MKNPPQYVGNDHECFLAMVMWWTCPQYLKKHAEGKMKRVEMRGGSHILGSLPLSLHMQDEVSKWFLHSLVSRYTLLTPQGCPTSLNYLFSFAGNKDRSEAKHI
jgi:hypothetical protein